MTIFILMSINLWWSITMAFTFTGLFGFIFTFRTYDKLEKQEEGHFPRFPGWDEITDQELLNECQYRGLIDEEIECNEWGENRKKEHYHVIPENERLELGWFERWSGLISMIFLLIFLVSFLLSFLALGAERRAEEATKSKIEQIN